MYMFTLYIYMYIYIEHVHRPLKGVPCNHCGVCVLTTKLFVACGYHQQELRKACSVHPTQSIGSAGSYSQHSVPHKRRLPCYIEGFLASGRLWVTACIVSGPVTARSAQGRRMFRPGALHSLILNICIGVEDPHLKGL